jgi:cell division protein FtsN
MSENTNNEQENLVLNTNTEQLNNEIDEALLEESPRSSSLPKILALLFVLVGVAGGWYYYTSVNKKNYNEVVIVAADDDEIKSKPSDPGGMVINNMDKDVYDALDKTQKNTNKTEILLPPAEEPINKKEILLSEMAIDIKKPVDDAVSSEKEAVKPVKIEKLPVPMDERSVDDVKLVEEKPVIAEKPVVIVAEKVPAKEKLTVKNLAHEKKPELVSAKPVEQKAAPVVLKAESKEAEEFIQPVTKKEAKTKPNFAKVADKAYKVQIASFKTVLEAEREWKNLSKRYKILKEFDYFIVSKEIEGKGVFQRLQVGPFANDDLAKKACQQFKEAGMSCFVIKP